jgi:acyl-CoA synthetase (AMP-forming)/AMP-acid ligase II
LGVEVKIVDDQDEECAPGDVGEVIAWSREQMAVYKYPRIVEIRDALPMTATGKY